MAAVREGEDEGWARFDPHPAAAGQANTMIPQWHKQPGQTCRQMLLDRFPVPDLKVYLGSGLDHLTWQMLASNRCRCAAPGGTDQEIEPVTANEHQHCPEDRPHPAHAQHMVAHCMLGDGTLAMPWHHGAIA